MVVCIFLWSSYFTVSIVTTVVLTQTEYISGQPVCEQKSVVHGVPAPHLALGPASVEASAPFPGLPWGVWALWGVEAPAHG